VTTAIEKELETAWSIGSDRVQEHTANGEHLRVVVAQAGYLFLGNLAAGSVLVVGSWDRIPIFWLSTWFAVLMGFNAARWTVGRRFPSRPLGAAEVRTWDTRLITSTAFSGAIWGSAGGFFFLPGQPDHNFFLALLIVGMAAAAATALSYHRFSYPAFFVPAVAPITVLLVQEAGTAEKAAGLVTPFYFLLMYMLSRHIYQAAHQAIVAGIQHQYLAYNDTLTGIANRRAFEEVLAKEWTRALRYQHPLSLVIADIDNFKRYNDEFGHSVGDEVLRAVAQLIEGRIRRGVDLAARIGGEEFALILPETDLAGAEALSNQILQECQNIESKSGRYPNRTTLSLGISMCVPSDGASADTLFEHADAALREAKERGKNRVVLGPPHTC
jgi:diguanylate cyclase (GGDEF)-like protein